MIISKRKKIVLIAGVAILFSCLCLLGWSLFIEPNRVVINDSKINIEKWPPAFNHLRVAVISDLHAGSPFIGAAKLKHIVALVNKSEPDLIIIPGDFVVQDILGGHFIEPETIAGELKNLRARLGVYAVLGNHDWWYDGPRVLRALDQAGIRVLENDVAEISRNGDSSLWLAGFSDLWTRPQRIEATLQKIPAGATVIALTHNPDTFRQIPASVTLTIAGHTHGGQVNIPLVGRPIVPSNYGQLYAAGHVQEGNRHLFVTTGIGTSIFPIRFRVPPEIAILTIEAK